MALADTKPKKISMFLMNPMVRKLDKVEEVSENHATYTGITFKTIFLLLLTVAGVAIFFATSSMIPTTYMEKVEGFDVNMIEASIALGSLCIVLFFPFFAFKFVKSSMILGSLYSLVQGYSLAFIFHVIGNEFVYPCIYALVLTILVVIVMMFLYRFKLVRVDKKFMSVISTVFFMGIFMGLITFLFSLFPSTNEYMTFLQNNQILVLVGSLIGVSIASLFLLVDFEVIHHTVEDKLPKKYEWLGAFALSFSIIELYLKILNLILRMMQQKDQK